MSEQSQQDLQRAEEARSFLVPRVQKFMDRARNADTATLTAQIYYFLQSLGAEEALQKLTDALRACGDLPNADEAAGMECDHRAAGPDGAPAACRGAHHPS